MIGNLIKSYLQKEFMLEPIIIPTGGSKKEDLERAKKAIQYHGENGSDASYIISGLGPDTNTALNSENPGKDLDFHRELYDYMINNTEGIFCIDTHSMNSVENILNVLSYGIKGKHVIISYPKHLERFEFIIDKLKEGGGISEDIEMTYVPVNETIKQKIYGTLALLKERYDLRNGIENRERGVGIFENFMKKVIGG